MSIADILSGLRRRWYVLVPGLLITAAIAFGAWTIVPPEYERTASQVLLPGSSSLPAESNPYLYIGGLAQAADIVVRAVGAESVLDPILEPHPGAKATVARDIATPGPVILITVSARSDAEAAQILESLVTQTSVVLEDLQEEQNIDAGNRISVSTVFIDETSTRQQKTRLLMTGVAALGGLTVSVIAAVFVDGLVLSRARRRG